jgi:hypothetical protein
MFHPSELKAMKAAQATRTKFTIVTKAKIVLLNNAYGVSYPDGRIDRCVNLATAHALTAALTLQPLSILSAPSTDKRQTSETTNK